MRRVRNGLICAAIFVLAAGITGASHANLALQVPLNQALVLTGGESSNPRDYDPATTHGSGDKLVFSGLVAFDPRMNLIPDLAETWSVSSDGMVYTFTLRANATFHDGRPVTAQDVIYSWERAANPKTESDTVLTYLGDIVGVQEMFDGKADHIRGLQALDDHHLQVRIDAPKPYFLLKLTYPTAFIVDQKNVESGPDWVYQPNGTGPYKLTEWKRGQQIVYQAYKDFYLGQPGLPYVVINIYAGIGTSLYEAGQVDMAGVGLYSLDRFLDPAEPLHSELYSSVDLCTDFVVFDTTQPPFDDLKVRQAFTEAFDRQRYIDVVMLGHALPAVGPYPPGLPGFDPSLKGLPFDPAAARQLLAQSKYGGPSGLPPIVYTDAGFGSSVNPDVAAMAQMWKQYLGVTIQIENIEPNFYLDETYAGHHGQLLGGGWCADYPDPENFADVLFHSSSQQNSSGLYDSTLDGVLELARVERDPNKRIQLYQQAEREIVFDAPVLFTVHSLSYMLVKPYMKGFVMSPIDISFERYMWIDGK